MVDSNLFGNQFEDLINDDADTKSLLSNLAKKQIAIVSPTVQGLLETFTILRRNELGIDSCAVKFEGSEFDSIISEEKNISLLSKDDKESSQDPSFVKSTLSLAESIESYRSSFLPKEFSQSTTSLSDGSTYYLRNESSENTLLRMIGLPDDNEIINDGADKSSKLFYLDPRDSKIKVTTLGVVMGENTSDALISGINDIIEERRRGVDKRKYSFNKVATNINQESYKTIDDLAKKNKDEELGSIKSGLVTDQSGIWPERLLMLSKGPGVGDEEILKLNYYNPRYLPAFYYLKLPSIQDSNIYGCVVESSKIVLKPFDDSLFLKINGVKPKTSLLETIIRLRLDKTTGNPGIYETSTESAEGNGAGTPKLPKNVSSGNSDSITAVECFLIEKLKTILFQLGDEYRKEGKSVSNSESKKNDELGSKPDTSIDKMSENEIVENKKKTGSYLKNLEILKAREDAILFLLKDTSSSSFGLNSSYSSLDLQDDIIRTSSGFSDALSGPLYSILSQKSEFYAKKISEAKRLMDMLDSKEQKPGLNKPPGEVLSTYLGVSPEDLIIYCIALLSIEQDYLIGLLSKNRRKVLVDTISSSIISSGNDPYGLKYRLGLSPNDGGFPSIIDSVNALTLLVGKIYLAYIRYTAGIEATKVEEYKKVISEYFAKN